LLKLDSLKHYSSFCRYPFWRCTDHDPHYSLGLTEIRHNFFRSVLILTWQKQVFEHDKRSLSEVSAG
jgi:hypothetical protein